MTNFTTNDLATKLVEFLPSAFAERSALSAAGAYNVSFNTNIVQSVNAGGASVVLEGAVKPETNIGLTSAPLAQGKLVHLFTTTDEFNDTVEGQEALSRFIQETTASLIKSFDILVINGTDPATGDALTGALNTNSIDFKSAKKDYDATADDINDVLYEALGTVDKPDYLLLSNKGYSAVGFSKDNVGNPWGLSRDAEFTYGPGVPAHRFQAVGLNGYTPSEEFGSGKLAVAGPFNKIVRAVNQISVRESKDATIGDVSMFTNNMTAYIVELGIKYTNTAGANDFVVVEAV